MTDSQAAELLGLTADFDIKSGFLLVDSEGLLGRQHKGAYDTYTSTLTHHIGREDLMVTTRNVAKSAKSSASNPSSDMIFAPRKGDRILSVNYTELMPPSNWLDVDPPEGGGKAWNAEGRRLLWKQYIEGLWKQALDDLQGTNPSYVELERGIGGWLSVTYEAYGLCLAWSSTQSDPNCQKRFNPSSLGVAIDSRDWSIPHVLPDTQAAEVGLSAGSIILKVNGEKVQSFKAWSILSVFKSILFGSLPDLSEEAAVDTGGLKSLSFTVLSHPRDPLSSAKTLKLLIPEADYPLPPSNQADLTTIFQPVKPLDGKDAQPPAPQPQRPFPEESSQREGDENPELSEAPDPATLNSQPTEASAFSAQAVLGGLGVQLREHTEALGFPSAEGSARDYEPPVTEVAAPVNRNSGKKVLNKKKKSAKRLVVDLETQNQGEAKLEAGVARPSSTRLPSLAEAEGPRIEALKTQSSAPQLLASKESISRPAPSAMTKLELKGDGWDDLPLNANRPVSSLPTATLEVEELAGAKPASRTLEIGVGAFSSRPSVVSWTIYCWKEARSSEWLKSNTCALQPPNPRLKAAPPQESINQGSKLEIRKVCQECTELKQRSNKLSAAVEELRAQGAESQETIRGLEEKLKFKDLESAEVLKQKEATVLDLKEQLQELKSQLTIAELSEEQSRVDKMQLEERLAAQSADGLVGDVDKWVQEVQKVKRDLEVERAKGPEIKAEYELKIRDLQNSNEEIEQKLRDSEAEVSRLQARLKSVEASLSLKVVSPSVPQPTAHPSWGDTEPQSPSLMDARVRAAVEALLEDQREALKQQQEELKRKENAMDALLSMASAVSSAPAQKPSQLRLEIEPESPPINSANRVRAKGKKNWGTDIGYKPSALSRSPLPEVESPSSSGGWEVKSEDAQPLAESEGNQRLASRSHAPDGVWGPGVEAVRGIEAPSKEEKRNSSKSSRGQALAYVDELIKDPRTMSPATPHDPAMDNTFDVTPGATPAAEGPRTDGLGSWGFRSSRMDDDAWSSGSSSSRNQSRGPASETGAEGLLDVVVNSDEQKLQAHLQALKEQRAYLFEIISKEVRDEELSMLRSALQEINQQVAFVNSRLASGNCKGLAAAMVVARDSEDRLKKQFSDSTEDSGAKSLVMQYRPAVREAAQRSVEAEGKSWQQVGWVVKLSACQKAEEAAKEAVLQLDSEMRLKAKTRAESYGESWADLCWTEKLEICTQPSTPVPVLSRDLGEASGGSSHVPPTQRPLGSPRFQNQGPRAQFSLGARLLERVVTLPNGDNEQVLEITGVDPESACGMAGLSAGDRILAIGFEGQVPRPNHAAGFESASQFLSSKALTPRGHGAAEWIQVGSYAALAEALKLAEGKVQLRAQVQRVEGEVQTLVLGPNKGQASQRNEIVPKPLSPSAPQNSGPSVLSNAGAEPPRAQDAEGLKGQGTEEWLETQVSKFWRELKLALP